MSNYFITATDTDAGKTYVACSLVHALTKVKNRQGNYNKVAVYKPISAGCSLVDNSYVNDDAKLLSDQANCQQSIAQINPIAFAEPIAPHIAAKKTKKIICLDQILAGFAQVQSLNADINVIEGAGGWRLPLGNGHYLSGFVKQAGFEVILVVNMKLGCLNHAVLTYESILNDGLKCVAWVANCQSEMPYLAENISELESLLPIPKLATLAFNKNIEQAAENYDLSVL